MTLTPVELRALGEKFRREAEDDLAQGLSSAATPDEEPAVASVIFGVPADTGGPAPVPVRVATQPAA